MTLTSGQSSTTHSSQTNEKVRVELRDVTPLGMETIDAFNNPMMNIGYGTTDPLSTSVFSNDRPISWDIHKIDAVTRSDPYFRKALEYHAIMPLLNGIDVYSDKIPSDEIQIIENLRQEKTDRALYDMMYQGLAYGGSGGLIMIKGQNNKKSLRRPLDLTTIDKDDFVGIKPVDRWFGISPTGQLLNDLETCIKYGIDPRYIGEPEIFYVWFGGQGSERFEVHRSRLIIYNSSNLPFIEKRVENFWGNSFLESVYQSLVRYHNTINSAVAMINKLNQRVVKIEGFMGNEQANKAFLRMVANKMKAISYGLNQSNTLFLSKEDDYDNVTATMAGVSEIIEDVETGLASALKVPKKVLFGKSTFKDMSDEQDALVFIRQTQENFLREAYNKLIPILYQSHFGKPLEASYTFKFKPLHIPTEKEIAETIKMMSDAIIEAYKAGILDLETALKSLPDVATNPRDIFHNISEASLKKGINGYGYYDQQIALAQAQQKEQVTYQEQRQGGMAGSGGDNTQQYGKPKKAKIGQKEK